MTDFKVPDENIVEYIANYIMNNKKEVTSITLTATEYQNMRLEATLDHLYMYGLCISLIGHYGEDDCSICGVPVLVGRYV